MQNFFIYVLDCSKFFQVIIITFSSVQTSILARMSQMVLLIFSTAFILTSSSSSFGFSLLGIATAQQ